ncbi:MAG: AAA family ATPase [Candidatus Aminicenantes bacterium]|nr:MAG: AAA family ATPase [Candidatus Aminicenantes bacterium]
MRIENIRLKNFKIFQDLHLENLPSLAIFVGANGTGKTTLFDVFGFVSDALKNNIRQALQKRGGFKEVISRGKTGFIVIELKFRLEIAGKNRLVTYLLEIGEAKGIPFVNREILRYKRSSYGSPYHFIDFSKGEGHAITNEEAFDKPDEELDREHQKLGSSDILAIKGLGQFERFKAANAFREFIENWHLSDFHITDARPSRDAGYAEHLSETGSNLPLVAQYILQYHPTKFKKILEKMKKRVPGIADVNAVPTEDGRILLKFRDGSFKDPFIAKHVSDGTIKMFAYLILLHDPEPHPLLCLEEPENQLYHSLMIELLEEFRDYTYRGGQVFISTHSPDLINGANPEEVYWLVKKEDGYAQIKRAQDDELITALYKEGSQLGYLWKQDYFKESHPK